MFEIAGLKFEVPGFIAFLNGTITYSHDLPMKVTATNIQWVAARLLNSRGGVICIIPGKNAGEFDVTEQNQEVFFTCKLTFVKV